MNGSDETRGKSNATFAWKQPGQSRYSSIFIRLNCRFVNDLLNFDSLSICAFEKWSGPAKSSSSRGLAPLKTPDPST